MIGNSTGSYVNDGGTDSSDDGNKSIASKMMENASDLFEKNGTGKGKD